MKHRYKFDVRLLVAAVAMVAGCGWASLSQADAGSADVEAGRALYMQKGCYECHGILGQGSITTGPALAPHPLPLGAMQAYVRNPKGQMPIFSAKILADDDVARIHAYLESIPPSPPVQSIALLNDGKAVAKRADDQASVEQPSRGAATYAANCAACHGSGGEGGVGPSLLGISGRYPTAAIEQKIREPLVIMPRLFPKPLNADDVREVARYVASLKDGR